MTLHSTGGRAAGARPFMSDQDFLRLSHLIESTIGIRMPRSKKLMIESRLLRRMRVLGLRSHHEYCEHLTSPQMFDNELVHFLDLATTNKTSFFREPEHFVFLEQRVLPTLLREQRRTGVHPCRLWSAGCSSGQEVYTLAMVAAQFFAAAHESVELEVLGTDVSRRVLAQAREATYPEDELGPVPFELRSRFFLKSKDRARRLVRVAPEIRSRTRFAHLNLMGEQSAGGRPFDVIFCRNVLIYFERERQQAIVGRLCRELAPNGVLFVGLSENLHGLDLPLRTIGRSVYARV